MKIIIWNIEWAKPGTKREGIIQNIITAENPDIICITEGYIASWGKYEHVICSDKDYGYTIHEGRRKVILIAKTPWINVDMTGLIDLPAGRYVSGITNGFQIMGVCIPWKDAHVRSGKKNRKPWEDHLAYLSGLRKQLESCVKPSIVLGDYNQRIPKKYSNSTVFESLLNTFENHKVYSKGIIYPIEKQSIDHISIQKKLAVNMSIKSIDNIQSGIRVSDHFGLLVNW